jgi:hypothetical protein
MANIALYFKYFKLRAEVLKEKSVQAVAVWNCNTIVL